MNLTGLARLINYKIPIFPRIASKSQILLSGRQAMNLCLPFGALLVTSLQDSPPLKPYVIRL